MKKIHNLVLLFSIIIFNFLPFGEGKWGCLYSQSVTQSPITYTQFQVSIGGSGTDVAHSIIQTTDGGYALAGYTWSFGGGSNAYIVKIDASGMLQWTRILGGTGWDDIASIIQTNDGGYIAAGSSIFKLDKNGTLEWCENISGWGNSIVQTSDNGYALAGYTDSFGAGQSDMFIVKLDSSAALQWARTVGGTGSDIAYSIIQTSDRGYAVAGISSLGIGLFTVIKLNDSGNLQWARTFVGTFPRSIIQTNDGGYAVVGRSPPTPYKFYIIKLGSTGELHWTRTVWLRDADIAKSIIQTTNGEYVVAGFTEYVEGYPDWYIVMLDSMGTLEWSRVVEGGAGLGDEAYSIIQTMDGGYAVAGVKDLFDPADDMYVVKYDSSWNTCGSNDSFVTSQFGILDTMSSVTPTVTSPTGFITPRTLVIGSGGTATMICVTGIQPISNKIPVSFRLYQNYPNPFNPITKIKFDVPHVGQSHVFDLRIIIYDILGREVTTLVDQELNSGTYEVKWDGTNYPSGVYFYRLEAEDASASHSTRFVETRKLVLIK